MPVNFQHESVVPAQAGTHMPQRLGSITEGEATYYNQRQKLWVPAYAGTTPRLFDLACYASGVPAHTFSNGTAISVLASSHSGTGRFFVRIKSGLNSFD